VLTLTEQHTSIQQQSSTWTTALDEICITIQHCPDRAITQQESTFQFHDGSKCAVKSSAVYRPAKENTHTKLLIHTVSHSHTHI